MRICASKFFSLLLVSFFYSSCFGQSILSDDKNCFELLKSGVKEDSVYKGNSIHEIWDFDSTALTCVQYTIVPNRISNYLLPDYKSYSVSSVSELKFYFFGGINTIYKIDRPNISSVNPILNPIKKCDTTRFIYTYLGFDGHAVNRKKYRLELGKWVIMSSDYFGYNDQGFLILLLQSEGKIQFYFDYNEEGCIVKETINEDVIVTFHYDEYKRKVSRLSDSQKVSYEYNEYSFISKKITEGKNAGEWRYEYKF